MEPASLPKATYQEDLDDDALVEIIQDDPKAFAVLYRRYAVGVYRYLYGRLGSRADAEELTTQVFIEALEALPRYKPRGKFAAWLFTIARRRMVDLKRSNTHGEMPLDWFQNLPTPGQNPLAQVIEQESLERLGSLYQQLDEEKQELIRLRFAAGLSYKQIGQLTGRSEAAAGMAMHRLLVWLKDHWEAEDEDI